MRRRQQSRRPSRQATAAAAQSMKRRRLPRPASGPVPNGAASDKEMKARQLVTREPRRTAGVHDSDLEEKDRRPCRWRIGIEERGHSRANGISRFETTKGAARAIHHANGDTQKAVRRPVRHLENSRGRRPTEGHSDRRRKSLRFARATSSRTARRSGEEFQTLAGSFASARRASLRVSMYSASRRVRSLS